MHLLSLLRLWLVLEVGLRLLLMILIRERSRLLVTILGVLLLQTLLRWLHWCSRRIRREIRSWYRIETWIRGWSRVKAEIRLPLCVLLLLISSLLLAVGRDLRNAQSSL